jgi:hypothetical protein
MEKDTAWKQWPTVQSPRVHQQSGETLVTLLSVLTAKSQS